jgi:hypothetical protein
MTPRAHIIGAMSLQGFNTLFIHVGTQRRKAGVEGQIKLEYDHTLAVRHVSQ